jgi:hypothetical protein
MHGMLKKILELLICILHPLAVVLIWINLAVRTDIGVGAKIAWALFSIIPLATARQRRCPAGA